METYSSSNRINSISRKTLEDSIIHKHPRAVYTMRLETDSPSYREYVVKIIGQAFAAGFGNQKRKPLKYNNPEVNSCQENNSTTVGKERHQRKYKTNKQKKYET